MAQQGSVPYKWENWYKNVYDGVQQAYVESWWRSTIQFYEALDHFACSLSFWQLFPCFGFEDWRNLSTGRASLFSLIEWKCRRQLTTSSPKGTQVHPIKVKQDKVGKAAYSPVVKDLMGSSPTTEQVETIRDTKANETRRKQIDFAALANMNFRTPKKK
jgi:hypothetical protein